jgi:hypothetical protein
MGVKTIRCALSAGATPAMPQNTPFAVPYPSLARKKVTAAFDGGRLSSDSGVMLLSLAERRHAIAKTLAALIDDPRDPAHITHAVEDVLRARIFAIACGVIPMAMTLTGCAPIQLSSWPAGGCPKPALICVHNQRSHAGKTHPL